MKIRTTIILAILFGGVIVGGVYAYFEARRDWEEKVEATNLLLESARDSINLLTAIAETINARADSAIAGSRVRVDSLLRIERIWRSRARETRTELDTLLVGVEDSVAAKIEVVVSQLEAQHEERVNTLRLTIIEKDTIIESWKAKYEIQLALNNQLQIALTQAEEQVEFWQGEAKPKLFKKFTDNWVVLLTGVGAGILIDQLLFSSCDCGTQVVVVDENGSHATATY